MKGTDLVDERENAVGRDRLGEVQQHEDADLKLGKRGGLPLLLGVTVLPALADVREQGTRLLGDVVHCT